MIRDKSIAYLFLGLALLVASPAAADVNTIKSVQSLVLMNAQVITTGNNADSTIINVKNAEDVTLGVTISGVGAGTVTITTYEAVTSGAGANSLNGTSFSPAKIAGTRTFTANEEGFYFVAFNPGVDALKFNVALAGGGPITVTLVATAR